MSVDRLKCTQCGYSFPVAPIYSCSKCGGILRAWYNYENFNINEAEENILKRYLDLLPINKTSFVTLGEGNTPLIKSDNLGKWLGIENLFLKNEGCNPTGSFKDRPISVGTSVAKDFGFDTAIIASSGNAGASVAAYAAKAGLKSFVLIPEGTPLPKIMQTLSFGAQIFVVEGTFSYTFNLAKTIAEKLKWANLATTFLNPFTVEGNKTIAYEIFESLEGRVPDFIAIPLGAGPLLVGIWWGFKDLFRLGKIKKMPRLIGVQAESCAPIAKAFIQDREVLPWCRKYKTLASGISDALEGYTDNGDLVIDVVKESNGFVTTVTESEIKESVFAAAQMEGVYAEPSGAVTIKAIQKLVSNKYIKSSDEVVAIITGNGLKENVLEFMPDYEIPVIKSYEDLTIKIGIK